MLNFSTLMVMSENPKALAEYYKKVFQKDEFGWQMGDYYGFMLGSGHFMVGPHDKVHGKNQNPERLIVNFETPDVEKEFERIKTIEGTTVVAKPYHPGEEPNMWLATFADLDGNYFQLATPMDMADYEGKN